MAPQPAQHRVERVAGWVGHAEGRRDALELKVEALRARKSTLAEADYYAQLDALLLDLARLYAPATTRP